MCYQGILINKRKNWLDSLRAIAMLLVVYGHCVREWTGYFIFTSPIKMPLFFIISGYLFNTRNGDTRAFSKNLLLKFIIPWLVLGMVHPTNPLSRFIDLISGKTLWFMPCLIIGETVWFFIRKYAKSFTIVITAGVTISAIGYFLSQWQLFDFAMFDTALVAQVFFVIGFVIREKESIINSNWKYILSLGIPFYIALSIAQSYFFPGSVIDVHLNNYFNIPYCLIIITVGCVTLFCAFAHYDVSNRILVYIGQNTLLIYIVHGLGINLFASLIPNTWGGYYIPTPIYALLRTVFAVTMCCLFAYFTNRYFPELVGKKRKFHGTKQ